MKRTIGIIGPIGSFEHNGKLINGIQLVDIVAQVSALPKETTELVVEFDTPGGMKDVGMAIYNYLKSIQPRIQVTSKQIGDIGSIGTVAWFAGTKRIAMKGKEFMIHNPWTLSASGDASQMAKVSESLKYSEEEMISFYSEQTGITKEGIAPLMKAETSFGADKAVELKFATEVYSLTQIAAYPNSNQNTSMEKSLKEKLLALFGVTVATAPPAELMGKPVTVDGKPAVDGKYTVVGGVVTLLEEAQATPAATPPGGAAAPPAAMAEVIALLKAQPSQEAAIAAAVKAAEDKLTLEIVALKKSIKTGHVPAAFTPETKADDVKEWDRSFKANEHMAMRKDDPEKYQRIFYAKYGRMPN